MGGATKKKSLGLKKSWSVRGYRERKNRQNGVDSDRTRLKPVPFQRPCVLRRPFLIGCGPSMTRARQCGTALTRTLIKINGAHQREDEDDDSDTNVTSPIAKREISSVKSRTNLRDNRHLSRLICIYTRPVSRRPV